MHPPLRDVTMCRTNVLILMNEEQKTLDAQRMGEGLKNLFPVRPVQVDFWSYGTSKRFLGKFEILHRRNSTTLYERNTYSPAKRPWFLCFQGTLIEENSWKGEKNFRVGILE